MKDLTECDGCSSCGSANIKIQNAGAVVGACTTATPRF
jgi:hypothetical protein